MFVHGVASGDPTDTSVVLWTRVTAPDGGEVAVEWDLVPDPDGEPGRHEGRCVARPADDHTLHVAVTGLEPGRRYRYRFRALGDEIGGSTRTMPRRADRLRFAVVCCSRWGWPGFEQYADVVDESPHFVLHLGDYIYEVGEVVAAGGTSDPPWECRTLDDYRTRYARHRSAAAVRRLHRDLPMIAVWDDHEVADNAPDDEGADRRQAGQRAWSEWMPMRRDADTPRSIDRVVTIEGLLRLLLIDARFSGRPPSDTDGPATGPVDGHLLAPEQWDLIERAVAAARAPWTVFANQVQVGPMTLGAVPAWRRRPWRRIVNPDQWDGFPDEQARVLDLLGAAPGRAVALSGDLHSAWSRTLRRRRRVVAHEFTVPSISGETYAAAFRTRTLLPEWVLRLVLRTLNRGIDHLDLARHGYVVCDVTPEELTATFVMRDGERHSVTLPAQPGAPALHSIRRPGATG